MTARYPLPSTAGPPRLWRGSHNGSLSSPAMVGSPLKMSSSTASSGQQQLGHAPTGQGFVFFFLFFLLVPGIKLRVLNH